MTAWILSAVILLGAQPAVVTDVTDSAITTRIKSVIGLNPNVNTFGIHIGTDQGVVTLSGRVEDETQKQLAESIARETKGVVDVVNNLTVIPTTITEKQERDFKQRASDKGVATSVRSRIAYYRDSKALKVGIDVVNGVVTLHGVVDTNEQKDRLAKIASETKGVTAVVNNLVVRTKERNGFIGGLGHNLGDEWVEKKIETAILMTRKLSIRELDVEVDDGICYLSGVVENEEMRKVAGDIAAGYKAVHEVNNAITVREGGVTVEPVKRERRPKEEPKVDPDKRIGGAKNDKAADSATESGKVESPTLEEVDPTDEPLPALEEKPLDPPK